MIGDAGLLALLPLIENMRGLRILRLAGNGLQDDAVCDLCLSFEDTHHNSIEFLDVR